MTFKVVQKGVVGKACLLSLQSENNLWHIRTDRQKVEEIPIHSSLLPPVGDTNMQKTYKDFSFCVFFSIPSQMSHYVVGKSALTVTLSISHPQCFFLCPRGILLMVRAGTFPWASDHLSIHSYVNKEDALHVGVVFSEADSLHPKRFRAGRWQMPAQCCPLSVFLISLLFILWLPLRRA